MTVDSALAWRVLEIFWINLLLSGDNAVLIALACRGLPDGKRRIGTLFGALGGVVLRIAFTLVVLQLMETPYLKIVGGALLLFVAVKLLIDEEERATVEAKPNLLGAVMSIIAADAVMSLDNVVAIAAAAHGSLPLIIFGIALSVPIIMFGAGLLLNLLDRFPLLTWAGAAVLGWVAGDLIAGDKFWERFSLPHEIFDTSLAVAGCVLTLALGWVIERLPARFGRPKDSF